MGSPLLAAVLWFFALQLVLKLELEVLGTTEVTARGFSRQRMISFCCAEEVAVVSCCKVVPTVVLLLGFFLVAVRYWGRLVVVCAADGAVGKH